MILYHVDFSDQSSETKNKLQEKNPGKNTNKWRLINMLQTNKQTNKQTHGSMKQRNGNQKMTRDKKENITFQNLCNMAKSILRL